MLKTIDLFAGAGGLSLGFKQTGHYELLAAAEIKDAARDTYKKNIPTDPNNFEFIKDVIKCNFTKLDEQLGGIDVVIGGPPCQGFSNANRQRNKLVSMNNSLVKEFFRAIKEIKPRAFVMENVSMLKSNTHRFYDSTTDHDTIQAIINNSEDPKNPLIHLREEQIVVSERSFEGISIMQAALDNNMRKKYTLPSTLYHKLEVLYKNRDNPRRLPKYLENHSSSIKRSIEKYCKDKNEDPEYATILKWLSEVSLVLDSDEEVNTCSGLEQIVALQKALETISEITDNCLIGEYSIDGDRLIFSTSSYAVIEYINAVLGDEYEQKGTTLNALWYGVPQDRKRHIVIGIRKDCLKGSSLKMPEEPEEYPRISVWDAISDLKEYPTSDTSDCGEQPYKGDEALTGYEAEMRVHSSGVKNHFSTKTSQTAQERFNAIEKGKNFLSLPKEMKGSYSKPERTQKTIYLRLDPTQPSGTVVNVRKSMWIHPELSRAVSVREAARLQSFPDWFEFTGTKDSQYQQVGNAVPPLLAKGIAEHLYSFLNE